jgi:hypothetical protein
MKTVRMRWKLSRSKLKCARGSCWPGKNRCFGIGYARVRNSWYSNIVPIRPKWMPCDIKDNQEAPRTHVSIGVRPFPMHHERADLYHSIKSSLLSPYCSTSFYLHRMLSFCNLPSSRTGHIHLPLLSVFSCISASTTSLLTTTNVASRTWDTLINNRDGRLTLNSCSIN